MRHLPPPLSCQEQWPLLCCGHKPGFCGHRKRQKSQAPRHQTKVPGETVFEPVDRHIWPCTPRRWKVRHSGSPTGNGRASGRERVGQDVEIQEIEGSVKKKEN